MRVGPALLLVGLLLATPARARVVLFGVDGGSWRVIDGMVAEGALPAFADLARRGVTADLETVEPVVSPVVWTSIATGRAPDAHGIGGFLTTQHDRRVPTIFERLAAAGLRVGLFEYLVTWPPSALPGGFVAPGWMRRDASVWPPDLFERAGVAPWRFDWPETSKSREAVVRDLRDEVASKPGVFQALLRAFEPDVAAVAFFAVDRASHRFWRDAYPGDFGDGATTAAPRPGSLVRELMVGVDAALGEVVAGLGPDDTVLVASDHGFQADPDRDDPVWVGRVRELLPAAGLDPERDGFQLLGEFGAVTLRVRPGPFAEREPVLERIVALFESMQTLEGEPLVRVDVLDGAPRPPGAERAWTNRLYQRGLRIAARLLYAIRFDEPAHAFVIARFRGDRLLALGPDAEVRAAGRTLRARELVFEDRFDGKHHETAIFLAAGGPLRAVAGRQRLSVLDVAPLVAYLAGQPVPDDLEGRVPEAWIAPAHLAAHPVRVAPAGETPRFLPARGASAPAVDDGAMQERLKALGYIR